MKNQCLVIGVAMLVAGAVLGQGSLTPPGGPAATMKTLDQVEPRTPVSGAVTISESGSYYLAESVSGGITISADDVTLDLNGFALQGGGSGNGITISSGLQGVTVCNGSINDFGSGVVAVGVIGCRFENLKIYDSASYGIYFNGASGHCNGNTVKGCTVLSSGSDGIHLIGSSPGECGYNMILDCVVGNCSGMGIYVEEGSAEACRGNEISGCRFVGNVDTEVLVEGVRGRIVDNVIKDSSGSGAGLDVQGSGNLVSGNEVQGHSDNYSFSASNQLELVLSEIPESIDWPASVRLAGSLSASGHGLTITSDDVTVDLGGFSIVGSGGASNMGIYISGDVESPRSGICIKDGVIRGFGYGILGQSVGRSNFSRLYVVDQVNRGIELSGICSGNHISACTIDDCLGGISFDGTAGGACSGNQISSTVISFGHNGVMLEGTCVGNTIRDCTICQNSFKGLVLSGSYSGNCSGNIVQDSSVCGNGYWGVNLKGYSGICQGNVIRNCTIQGNEEHGIEASHTEGCRFDGNTVSGTTGTGSKGIYTYGGQDNLIVRNHCTGQTSNFDLEAADTYGPIVTASGALSTNGVAAHAWANFSY